ncbi:MAG TPA: tetratricopeptide repeat protein [Pyrinomonadaceae bacterium]|nr:tetratricopeptide repeat protein [Pyrinomonadaceae bacterium]
MAKMFMSAIRALVVAACLVASGAAVAASAQQQQQPRQNQNTAPKKKKLPPGAKGFAQFADRDASDKLVTGGATRNVCQTYEQLIECAMGQAGETPPNLKEAVGFYNQAAALKPDMFRPHYNLGQIYESQGKYKEAAAAYKRAVTRKVNETMGETPEHILSAYFNLGNVYAMLNDHAQSIATFREVIRRLPQPVHTPHYNVGLSQAALGKHHEAVNSFKEAVKIKPDYWEAHYNLGVAYSKLEDYPQAIAAFKKTLEFKPDDTQARYNLGLAYYFMDDPAALAAQVQALQQTQPELAKELAKLKGK